MFAPMKRLFTLVLALACASPVFLQAQTPEAAAAAAERDAAEERTRRLNTLIEGVQDMQQEQAKGVEQLRKQFAALRDDMEQKQHQYASLEDVKKLAEAIQDVDRKREADKKLILEEISKIAKAVASAPVAPVKPRPPVSDKPADTAPATPQKGFDYVIREGDTLSVIAAAYREQGIKVTADDILKANPGLKAEKLVVGKKIFIPQK